MKKREADVFSVLGRDVESITRLAHELDKNYLNQINQKLLPLEISQTQTLFIFYLEYYADLPAHCIGYCTRTTGGTAYTLRYAEKQ